MLPSSRLPPRRNQPPKGSVQSRPIAVQLRQLPSRSSASGSLPLPCRWPELQKSSSEWAVPMLLLCCQRMGGTAQHALPLIFVERMSAKCLQSRHLGACFCKVARSSHSNTLCHTLQACLAPRLVWYCQGAGARYRRWRARGLPSPAAHSAHGWHAQALAARR